MPSELQGWQDDLARHFGALRDRRCEAGADLPVFGLEHGLHPSDVAALESAIKDHIANGRPIRRHPLPWVVYTSELGYRYAGDEYWQTFDQETPGWSDREDRDWIRECYRCFRDEFGGAEPSGPWAEHFSIICWPITHAILPKDLQRQLAETLYELRYRFSMETLQSPSRLGNLIASRSWTKSHRFQNFVQERDLLGQIAMALLLHEEPGTGRLLHPGTLARISLDLEHERKTRGWLQDARKSAKERLNVRGLMLPGSRTPSTGPRPIDSARKQVTALGIEPRLILRPIDQDQMSWDVWLEIPDLSGLLHRFPGQRDVLTNSRCMVAGSSGRPLARGRLLHGPQQVRLQRWPEAEQVLIDFGRLHDPLEFLLRTECLLRPGPKWLFRIAADGLAYECRTLRVRPDENYILASTDPTAISGSDHTAINLACEGIYGRTLELPPALDVTWQDELQRLGLQQTSNLEVWPAGLGAVTWDGEGYGSWLASDRPCLAIAADHPLASVEISVEDDPTSTLEIETIEPSQPVFVEVPRLPIGVHRIRVSVRRNVRGEIERLDDLGILVRVQAPRQSVAGTSPHSAFQVRIDPERPSLEEFREGKAEVSILGPQDRQVNCEVAFLGRDRQRPSFSRAMRALSMPVSSSKWQASFDRQFGRDRRAQEAYDTARLCRLRFDAGELRRFTADFEREFSPLRWAFKGSSSARSIRLIDDSGNPAAPEVFLLAFDKPCEQTPLGLEPEYSIPPSGGMYMARREARTAAQIVMPRRLKSFEALRCDPVVQPQERSIQSVTRSLYFARIWREAGLSGDPLSRSRQQTVLKALTQEIFRLIGGDYWGAAERKSSNHTSQQLEALSRAVFRQSSEQIVGADLLDRAESLSQETLDSRIAYLASLATKYCRLPRAPESPDGQHSASDAGPESPQWLCALALRLASDAGGVEEWAAGFLPEGLRRLLELPTIARAARFLVIAVDACLQEDAAGELYRGWNWE